ncbi:MAG TPA: hypothetical protein VK823_18585 [Streptosporangiaceae bacterium]|nr:hypothetical protein [Streptosporangiaceae bacterium]
MLTGCHRLAAIAAGLLIATVLAGCTSPASGGADVVFAPVNDFSQGEPATTIDVVDIGMIYDLDNTTATTITLRSVRLAFAPRTAHLKWVAAYSPYGPGVGLARGDLLKYCRSTNRPYPLTSVVVGPHGDSNWHIVLEVTFFRPGRYDLHRIKVSYTANGQPGWQYLYVNTTIVVSAAPKNAKPAFSGCW